MRNTVTIAFFLISLAAALPRDAQAVSYPLIEEQREEKAAKGIREKGETVCLFESGTAEIRRAIAIGDVLSVYRQEKNGAVREVGKIKVLSKAGTEYLRGEVVTGQVMNGDLAKKGDIAGLVISSDERCK